jgi:sulfate adenylyltransferase
MPTITRSSKITPLIAPCGGDLVDLVVDGDKREALREEAGSLPYIQLSDRALCDLELLAIGAFSPLDGFMNREDFESVIEDMRLANGQVFPIPVTLPIGKDDPARPGDRIALRDRKNVTLAVMTVEEIYDWNPERVTRQVFGTTDPRHPLVAEMDLWGDRNVSGRIEVLELPRHYDFQDLRLTPRQTRQRLEAMGHKNVVAFQTRNPLHRVHEELTNRAIAEVDATLLLHPVVGMTKPGDIDHFTRVRTYRVLAANHYPEDRILLALLPLAMRMAGPREALWHAVIRRNFGANHLIVGRDHASPGKDSQGKPFYGPYDAQELVQSFADELGVQPIPFQELVYLPEEDRYEEADRIPAGATTLVISGTQVRDEYLRNGRSLPEWFTRPEVAEILSEAHPPRHRQGACIWFTGLSGAGKSTTAEVMTNLLLEQGRNVTVLDGDVVRTHLSHGLGFSKDDRDRNILRIGFVAAEIARHGGIVICAAVSPYRATRNEVRRIVGDDSFIEVFVDTPLDVCEERDVKGMYARARRGEIQNFTGIDDPYENPVNPEITIATVNATPEENARRIVEFLRGRGYMRDLGLEA